MILEIGDLSQRGDIASLFFSTIHTWLPFVSRQKILRGVLQSEACRADEALLLLAMKLVNLAPFGDHGSAQTVTYSATLDFFSTLHKRGCLTVATLQAAILLAIYELGHAIYPAAYISVSSCVQFATIMGLNWTISPWLTKGLSWIEAEELRRIWWTVVILER